MIFISLLFFTMRRSLITLTLLGTMLLSVGADASARVRYTSGLNQGYTVSHYTPNTSYTLPSDTIVSDYLPQNTTVISPQTPAYTPYVPPRPQNPHYIYPYTLPYISSSSRYP